MDQHQSTQNTQWRQLLAVSAAPLFCFLGALPPLYRGTWVNTAGVAWLLCLSIAFLLLGKCLITLIPRDQKTCARPSLPISLSPLLLSSALLLLLSVANLLVTQHPMLSWLGAPDLMMGGWIWLAIGALLLIYNPGTATAIQEYSVVTVLVLSFLSIVFHPKISPWADGSWVLYTFLAYLTWVGLSSMILSTHYSRNERWALLSLGVVLVILSKARLGIIGLCVGSLLFFCIRYILPQKAQRHCFLGSLLALPFLYLCAVAICYHYHIMPSIVSRFISIKVIVRDLLSQPWYKWVVGNGWGRMTLLVEQQHASLKDLRVISPSGALEVWEGLWVKNGSSLNQILDATHAVGVLGGLAMFVLAMAPYLLYLQAPERLKSTYAEGIAFVTAATSTLMTHGWFMMLSVLPLWVTSLHITWPVERAYSVPLKVFLGAALLGALALLWTAQQIPT